MIAFNLLIFLPCFVGRDGDPFSVSGLGDGGFPASFAPCSVSIWTTVLLKIAESAMIKFRPKKSTAAKISNVVLSYDDTLFINEANLLILKTDNFQAFHIGKVGPTQPFCWHPPHLCLLSKLLSSIFLFIQHHHFFFYSYFTNSRHILLQFSCGWGTIIKLQRCLLETKT